MGRAPCCDKASVKKGPWSPEEDAKLKDFIHKHGTCGNWITLPHKAGLKRCGKSCRLRWLNYLRPNIKHGEFSDDEDKIICSLYANIGSRWSIIAAQLPGRTDNDIKNYWNTKLKKKLLATLPPLHKNPSFFPSLPLQSPPPPPPPYINFSSPFHHHTPFTTNTDTLVQDHLIDLSPPPPPPPHPMTAKVDENSCYLGFQDTYNKPMHEYNNNNNSNYYYYVNPETSEVMLMFGTEVTSSSEGGASCITYNNNKDHNQIHVKQEDQIALDGFGNQTHPHNYIHQKSKGYFKNSYVNNNINIKSYLLNDDENKVTHYDDEEMDKYYYSWICD